MPSYAVSARAGLHRLAQRKSLHRAVEDERPVELLACLRTASFGDERLSGTELGLGLVRRRADHVERLRRLLELPVEDLAPGLQPEARRGLQLAKALAQHVRLVD